MYSIHLIFFSVAFFFVGVVQAHPGGHKFIFDLKKSSVMWKAFEDSGGKEGVHFGRIFLKDAAMTLRLSKKNPPNVNGEFVIDMSSLVCDDIGSKTLNKKFISHMKGEDFLSVENFPVAKFQVTKIKFNKDTKSCNNKKDCAVEEQKYAKKTYITCKEGTLSGTLQFLGVTKEIKHTIKLLKEVGAHNNGKRPEGPCTGEHGVMMEGGFQLNLRDFGMNYFSSKVNKSKDKIKDLVDISIRLFALAVDPE